MNRFRTNTEREPSHTQKARWLSEIQQGMLYDMRLHQTTDEIYYNSQIILTFKIVLFEKILEQAWSVVMNDHRDVFSLAISDSRHDSTYLVLDSIDLPIRCCDLTCYSLTTQTNLLNSLLTEDINKPFNMEKPPLMRVTLVRLSNSRNTLVWTKHHLLMDGMGSFLTLKRVFAEYYRLLNTGFPLKNYSVPTHPTISVVESPKERNYWQRIRTIHQKAAYLFSSEKLIKKCSQYQIKEYRFQIGGKVYQQINTYIDQHSLTLSILLQAALAITLSVYTNANHVAFGMVRRFPHRERYGIGLFTNTLPVAMEIPVDGDLRDFLRSILENNLSIRHFCKTPLRNIKKMGNFSDEKPLFQVLLDYKPQSLDILLNELYPDMQCQSEFHLKIPYPFTVEIVNRNTELTITLSYDKTLFNGADIKRIFATYSRLLRTIVNGSIRRLSDIKTLSQHEFQQIAIHWNGTQDRPSVQKTLHEYIEYHAKYNGDKSAIIHGQKQLTYRNLNRSANQLARYLQSQGIGNETPVAIGINSSFMRYIGLLAILKCGATLVPLDTKYPRTRIAAMLRVSHTKYILTTSTFSHVFEKNCISLDCIPILKMDTDVWKTDNDTDLNHHVPKKSAAYIVFTSGSTGIPKGVVIEHEQWITMLGSVIKQLEITDKERILQLSAFGFDVFQCEWGLAMLSGASLCIFENTPYCSKKIINVLRNDAISLVICSSSIVMGLPHVSLPKLRKIALGGEPCDKETLNYWSTQVKLYHIYGVTEAAICSTLGRYFPNQPILTIGKPLPLVNIYILNSRMQLCPMNVVGEIYIGGAGVARGYLDDMETQKHFVSVIVNQSAERLYKTGDLARWLPSGEIEFIGRIGDFIKIRGHRVEVAEIEKALCKMTGILKAYVTLTTENSKKHLAACVLVENHTISAESIRKFLSCILPVYMIPHYIAAVDEIPLTTNGKIDQKKIIEIASIQMQPHHACEKPATQVAHKATVDTIKRIAENTLSVQNLLTDKNFFDLGFDSISLSTFHLAIEKSFATELNLIDLLTHSTIESLAEFMSFKGKT